MHFKSAASLLALAGAASAAVSADQMVSNIDAITELSSQTNTIAQSISITNFFSTAPQMINNFKQIITMVSDDISAMTSTSKRDLVARQDCLNVENPQQCLEDLFAVVSDPEEVLGGDKKKRQTATYTDAEQGSICDAFRGFVQVHQQLLATVIGKHGLLSLTPFTQPVAQVLRSLEGGVDTIAFDIIDDVPTCAQSATDNKNSLDMTLGQAIDTYSD